MDIFRKGLVRGLCPKNRNFSYRCFLQKICQRKSFLDILDRKQSFKEQKIEVLPRAKKLPFSNHSFLFPSILSKNQTFSCRRFSQKSYQKRSFLILWNEKNKILRGKN